MYSISDNYCLNCGENFSIDDDYCIGCNSPRDRGNGNWVSREETSRVTNELMHSGIIARDSELRGIKL